MAVMQSLIIILIASLNALLFIYISIVKLKHYWFIKNTTSSTINQENHRPVFVQGKLNNLQSDLIAPLSGRPCCYFSFYVFNKHSNKRRFVLSGSSAKLLKLTDETETCLLNCDGANWLISPKKIWNGVPESLSETTLQDYPALASLLKSPQASQYTFIEKWIEPGTLVSVLTTLKKIDVKNDPFIALTSGQPQTQPHYGFINNRWVRRLQMIFYALIARNVNTINKIQPNFEREVNAWESYAKSISPKQNIIYGSRKEGMLSISDTPLKQKIITSSLKSFLKYLSLALIAMAFVGYGLMTLIPSISNAVVLNRPLSSLNTSVKTLENTYEQPNGYYTIKYPKDWIYGSSEKEGVLFSGPKSSPSFNTLVKIVVMSSSDPGNHYYSTHDVLEDIKRQLSGHGKLISTGNVKLQTNPTRFKGEYVLLTYTYRNIAFKQIQCVIAPVELKNTFYLLSYTAHANLFDSRLPIFMGMLDSWVIK